MKRTLLIVATQDEWNAVLEAFKEKDRQEDCGALVVSDGNLEWTLMKGGIGKTAMAFSIGKQIGKKRFDLVVNTGVAGTLFHRLKPLTVLCPQKSAFYDVFLPGLARGQMAGQPLYFEASKDFYEAAKKLEPGLCDGIVVTGDNFITKDNIPENLDRDFEKPVAIDMESAAVGQCCHMANIPFAILRTISDDTGNEGNEDQYYENLGVACKKAVGLAISVIKETLVKY